MALLPSKRDENDMTRTGILCANCLNERVEKELEQVSGERTYTCHRCGRVERRDRHGKIEKVEFEGFA